MDIKMGGLLGGLIGVVGTTGLAFYSGDHPEEAFASIARRGAEGPAQSEEQFCMLSDAPFFDELKKGECYSSSSVSQLYKRDIVDNQGSSVVVILSAPPTAPEASDNCRTCNDYARMNRLGWFALSNRDQRREEFFRRACGMLDYLKQGEKAETSFFSSSTLNAADVRTISMESLPRLGVSSEDEPPSAPINTETTTDETKGEIGNEDAPRLSEDGSWRLAMETDLGMQRLSIQPLAVADFDGDSIEDILVYVHAGIENGTAINGTIGLLSKTAKAGEIYFVTE